MAATAGSNPFLMRAQRFGLQAVTVPESGSSSSSAGKADKPDKAKDSGSRFGSGPPSAASSSSGNNAIKAAVSDAISKPAYPFAGEFRSLVFKWLIDVLHRWQRDESARA